MSFRSETINECSETPLSFNRLFQRVTFRVYGILINWSGRSGASPTMLPVPYGAMRSETIE